MRQEAGISRRQRRAFSAEFKANAVEQVRRTCKRAGQVAKELDLTETALREWDSRADAKRSDAERSPVTALETENDCLRIELQRVTMERDFRIRAAAFFAKDADGSSR